MVKKTVEITNETGLHARPASMFVNKVNSYECEVFLEKDDQKVNAKSILGLLTLGLDKGKKVDIVTEGKDEEKAANELSRFLAELKD